MDQMLAFDAILFPADDSRLPHLVSLTTSPLTTQVSDPSKPCRFGRMPHPEMYMDYIAEGLGPRSWRFQVIELLEGMTRRFTTPFVIFYPTVSRDGMPFPISKWIRAIQGNKYRETKAWRGNVVVAKFRDQEYASMMNATMADFPIIRNWLSTTPVP